MRRHPHRATEPRLGPSADCLDEALLQEISAGIAPAGIMEKHGEDIANCDRCALLLKTYLFEFSDEMTAEEGAILSGLESSKPEWQKKLVQKMLRHMNLKPGGQTESDGRKPKQTGYSRSDRRSENRLRG